MRCEIESELFSVEQEPGSDRRKFIRVPVTLEVRYWSRNELKDRYIPVLGEGGLFVATVDPLAVGTQLDLELVEFMVTYKIDEYIDADTKRREDAQNSVDKGLTE